MPAHARRQGGEERLHREGDPDSHRASHLVARAYRHHAPHRFLVGTLFIDVQTLGCPPSFLWSTCRMVLPTATRHATPAATPNTPPHCQSIPRQQCRHPPPGKADEPYRSTESLTTSVTHAFAATLCVSIPSSPRDSLSENKTKGHTHCLWTCPLLFHVSLLYCATRSGSGTGSSQARCGCTRS